MWKKYREMWDKAEVPEQAKLVALWDVSVALLPLWSDIKRITKRVNTNFYVGWNTRWLSRLGGYFKCDVCKNWVELNYDVSRNDTTKNDSLWKRIKLFFTRRVVDHIRICPDGTIIGRFHLRVGGRLLFLSWFTMERI